jgi:phenylpropionate dioxygenase-like ring-hydroxylating dioxygenase large terminal subunit
MAFLENCWYVAAWDHEVEPGRALARRLLNQPIALYRTENGEAHALFDRCPHRFAPLSQGTVCGSALACRYHGLEFDGTGACTRNPHGHGAIPAAARVRSFPLVERYSLLWIWMGEADRADPASIPDFSSLNPVVNIVGKGYLHARAHYQLEVDNIMDLSHIDYLHQGSLGGESDRNAAIEVVQEGHRVWSRRLARNERLSAELEKRNHLAPGTRVDRWLDVRWDPPGVMELRVGHVPTGTPEPRRNGKERLFVHLFTPETETATHYWFGSSVSRALGPAGEAMMAEMIPFLRKPFEAEDLPMLEAQQATMGDAEFWSLKPILLAGDAAAVRARRVQDALIDGERKSHADAVARK